MKRIETQAGQLKRKVRNRSRSIGKRVITIAAASRLGAFLKGECVGAATG
jgi:hypothetical protein